MRRIRHTLFQVLRGASDANIGFNDLRVLLGTLGFEERIKGSHHIFTREDVEEIVNVQPKGGKGFSMNYLSVFPLCCLNNVREETACCYCLSAWNQTVT